MFTKISGYYSRIKVLQFAWVSTIQVGMRTWCDGPPTYLKRIDLNAQLKLEQKFVNSLYHGDFGKKGEPHLCTLDRSFVKFALQEIQGPCDTDTH
jgi:hypothetical protein